MPISNEFLNEVLKFYVNRLIGFSYAAQCLRVFLMPPSLQSTAHCRTGIVRANLAFSTSQGRFNFLEA